MIELLAAVGSRWLSLVWPLAWQGTLVALIALALLPLARRVGPSLALGLLGVALLKFFVPPVATSPVAFVDAAAAAIRPSGRVDGDEVVGGVLFLIHLAGMAVCAARVWQRRRWLGDVLAGSSACDRPETIASVRRLAAQLNLRDVPAVRLSPLIDSPMAAGVTRPVVLLPSGLAERLSPEQIDMVLAHELAHHRARDLRFEWLLAAATTVWWFHPIVWTLAARVRAAREDRCDDRVVALGIDPYVYCRVLLEVAAARQVAPAIAMRAAGHSLRRRFDRLISGRRPGRAAPALAVAGTLLFASLALPHSPWRLADREPDAAVLKRVHVSVERITSSPRNR
jgi:beta-lactamase regulating signal transducer with metallopeptidase domain